MSEFRILLVANIAFSLLMAVWGWLGSPAPMQAMIGFAVLVALWMLLNNPSLARGTVAPRLVAGVCQLASTQVWLIPVISGYDL